MSLANFWNPQTQEIYLSKLDVSQEFDLFEVPFNGGGTGGTFGTLQQVLQTGNNAGDLNMTNINNITCSNLNVSTINNSAYPPSGGNTGATPTLSQVLTSGNDASNQTLLNVSSVKLANTNFTTLQASSTTSGVLQVVNSSNVVGNVYDSVFNQPPSAGFSIAQKSWINAPQTSISANTPISLHFSVSDASQSYNTSDFTVSQVNVAGYTSGTYYCYQNSSSNPITLSGSLNVSFSGTENTYLGLACCYIPSNAVSNGTGNESFNPWINLINAIWSYYTGNQPGWQNICFNTVLQPNDYITFFAMSNNDTAVCNPLPSVFGISTININSRLTIVQHL